MTSDNQAEYRRHALFGQMLETILWSSLANRTEDDQTTMDDHATVHDFDGASIESLEAELKSFCELAADDIEDMDPLQLGHDFALTRDGHGTGFWDRGLGERGERLSEVAKTFGSIEAYLVENECEEGSDCYDMDKGCACENYTVYVS